MFDPGIAGFNPPGEDKNTESKSLIVVFLLGILWCGVFFGILCLSSWILTLVWNALLVPLLSVLNPMPFWTAFLLLLVWNVHYGITEYYKKHSRSLSTLFDQV